MVKQINSKEEFLKETSNGKVIIDFFADWCGPCKMMGPFFEEASNEVKDIKFLKINIDEVEDVAAQYGITSIPTAIVMNDGKELKRNVGFANTQKILEFIK